MRQIVNMGKCWAGRITIDVDKRMYRRRNKTRMMKNNLLRIALGVILAIALSGVSEAYRPIVPHRARKFIHYFEAAGESRELSMVERVWLALLMTSQERREQRGEFRR